MKKLLIVLASLIFVLLIGCEENFSPKSNFEEKYALTCIVRGDTALQVAAIYGSYDIEGYDPSINEINPAYRGADLRLWYQDTVYVFKDSTVYNSSSPDSLFHFYYLDNFKPESKGELLEIEATLANGKRLKASCYTPDRFTYNAQETSNTIPAVNTSTVNVVWNSEDANNFFVGRLKIKYFQTINGATVQKWFYLPVSLVQNGNQVIQIFPVPSKAQSIAYSQSAIDHAFTAISDGIENKGDITISNIAFIEVLSIDANLSRYYASTLEDNRYTVRVNEMDFSNIDGGFGVFGALQKVNKNITVQTDYIKSFGYKVLFEN